MRRRTVPLASQLVAEMATDISSGALFSEEGRLPSEADLGRRYGVSRSTVREALAQLEQAGVISRRRGIGTFVSQAIRTQPGTIWGWLDEAPAFVDLIAQSGHQPSCHLLQVKQVPAGEMADFLDIDAHEILVTIEKLFFADDEPVIYSFTAVPYALLSANREAATLSSHVYQKPIYQIFRDHSELIVDHQASELRAVLADAALAERLNCEGGLPLLQVEEVGHARGNMPLFYARHHFRGDRISFRQVRTPTLVIETEESYG